MKKILFTLFVSLIAASTMACTNVIVGKKASATGAVMCTYSADSYGFYRGMHVIPGKKHAPGEMLQIYDYDSNKYLGEIPEAPETYNVVGHINEYQVAVMETTFGGRAECEDTTGLIDYGSLMYIALQRAKTAREALKVMTNLVETYGYYSEGESFSVCDADEAWILEMIGQGAGSKKVIWIAQRIPDDAISGHANQSRIRKVNLKDKENVMISTNCIPYARQMGWFKGKDADFSFAEVYGRADFGGRRICDARVWSWFNRFDPEGMKKYFAWAEGKDPKAKPLPLWIVPNRKVTLQDVQAAMRDHYENTPLAIDVDNDDPGKGLWNMPYRPTPLYFEVDGQKYFNERPISTQQAAFSIIAELRSWMPRQVGAVLWWAHDDANMCAQTPLYGCITEAPLAYNVPGVDATHFSNKSAFWVCNWVSNMVYPRYSQIFPELKTVRDSLDASYAKLQPQVEAIALELLKKDEQAAVKYLTDYSAQKANEMVERWNDLAIKIIVKYNDMVVKEENPDGSYKKTPYGWIPRPYRPGYHESTKRAIVNSSHKERYTYPKE